MSDDQRLLPLAFAHRMVRDLASNNVLRGAWAEQLVAHFLGIDEIDLPPNWTYYDMVDACGREISVKHSIGPRARFAVTGSEWAWDDRLRKERRETEGWYGGTGVVQHWCHVYVFAWLDTESSQPSLDGILDPDAWRFATMSRADMYRKVAPVAKRTIGLTSLGRLTEFVAGTDLRNRVDACQVDVDADADGVPGRVMKPYPRQAGLPVVDVTAPRPEGDSPDQRPDAADLREA